MPIHHVISEFNRACREGLISAYAIGGAVAAAAYIEAASTEDVDVFVAVNSASHPLDPFGPVLADLVRHGARYDRDHLVIGGWPVQLLPLSSPLYEEAIAEAVDLDFGGETGRVMRPQHLAAIALATGRAKDYQRVAEFLRTGVVDLRALTELVERHGLAGRFNTYLTRFPPGDA